MKNKYSHLAIGQRLKELRKNLSQIEFAKKIDVSIATYQRYEYGETLPPQPVLRRIAEICGTTVDAILGRDGFASLKRLFDSERQKIAEGTAELSALDAKVRAKLQDCGIPLPPNTTAFLEIVSFYANQGINLIELIKSGEKPSIIPYEGIERRKNWPYTQEEQYYINKVVEILRGKNKKNAQAIKQNIDAFYDTRDVEIPLEAKKAEGA